MILLFLFLLCLAGCAGDVAPIADDELVDVGQLDAVDAVDQIETRAEVDASSDVDAVDLGALEAADTAPPDVLADVPPADTRETCVKRCLEPAGVPLGYFCSKGSDCCSGNCAPPDNRCAPPADTAGWSECPK